VRVFSGADRSELASFDAFLHPAFQSDLRLAVADLNADGQPDIVTAGDAEGNTSQVYVFSHLSGLPLAHPLASFLAYEARFRVGAYVAAGDVNGDGRIDLITGAGVGGGPHVKVFSGVDGSLLSEFLAYAAALRGGVRVAAIDLNGDGRSEIITGAGPSGGPHLRIFDAMTGAELQGMFTYDARFLGGNFVAAASAGSMSPPVSNMQANSPPMTMLAPPFSTMNGSKFAFEAGKLPDLRATVPAEMENKEPITPQVLPAMQRKANGFAVERVPDALDFDWLTDRMTHDCFAGEDLAELDMSEWLDFATIIEESLEPFGQ
jgi:hypothetical protein